MVMTASVPSSVPSPRPSLASSDRGWTDDLPPRLQVWLLVARPTDFPAIKFGQRDRQERWVPPKLFGAGLVQRKASAVNVLMLHWVCLVDWAVGYGDRHLLSA
jgi:hypothetical protein